MIQRRPRRFKSVRRRSNGNRSRRCCVTGANCTSKIKYYVSAADPRSAFIKSWQGTAATFARRATCSVPCEPRGGRFPVSARTRRVLPPGNLTMIARPLFHSDRADHVDFLGLPTSDRRKRANEIFRAAFLLTKRATTEASSSTRSSEFEEAKATRAALM